MAPVRTREGHNEAVTGLALFDLDNTLVDRQSAFERWAEGFVQHHGLPREALDVLSSLDEHGFAPREQVFQGIRARFDMADPVDALISSYRATYPGYFYPDREVNRALSRLRTLDWTIGVVTNGPPSQRLKLERAELLGQVDAICISDEMGVAKPDRRIFEEAAHRCLGSDPPEGPRWMIGDTPLPDIAGGIGAGFKTIWLHHGRRWEPTSYRPDAQVASVTEAVDLLIAQRGE